MPRERSRGPTPVRVRGRLLRQYALVFAGLVAGSLLISALVEGYFSYRANRQALVDLQTEKATGAAVSIQRRVDTIARQVASEVQADHPYSGLRTIVERQNALVDLMLLVPELNDLAYLDTDGIQRSHVSRQVTGFLDTTPSASHLDRSTEPAFLKVVSDAPYYGPVIFRDGKAYLTFAVVDEGASGLRNLSVDARGDGATLGIMDLGFVPSALRGVDLGGSGRASIVDGGGRTVAETRPTGIEVGMLGASARVDPPGWALIVEQPSSLVFTPLKPLILRLGLVAAAAILLGVVGSVLLARRLVTPIEVVRAGARRLAAGDLTGRITVRTGDDLETLADEFNRMTERLNASQAALEQKVQQRSAELAGAATEIDEKSRQLEAASQRKSEFLAKMSHELRTPLNAVIGFSDMLTEQMYGELNPKQLDYVGDIHASGLHLLSLVDDVLDLTKVEAGEMGLQVTSFSLPDVLARGLTMVRERASRQGVALESEIDPRLGRIEADERKIKQIIFNLLANGVKFTAAGGVVRLSAEAAGDVVVAKVIDSGIGIVPAEQARIFDEFQQVGKPVEGTGLGLTLVKKFVELHGGRIWVESLPGKGSTFTIELPLRQPAEAVVT